MANSTSNQGFAAMDPDERRTAARKGGKKSTGKFKSGDQRTVEAGKRGAEAQPLEAKRRGGMNSHRGDQAA